MDVPAAAVAIVPKHRSAYPAEVTDRRPVTPATDIHLAAWTIRRLLRRPPRPLHDFLRGCTRPARPNDAWQLLGELDEVLERLHGRRRFRPFKLGDDHGKRTLVH